MNDGRRAILGSRAGRGPGQTAEAARRALEAVRAAHAFSVDFHTCGGPLGARYGHARYTVGLAKHEICEACGYAPGLGFPDHEYAARTLAAILGADDARAWFEAAAHCLEWDNGTTTADP